VEDDYDDFAQQYVDETGSRFCSLIAMLPFDYLSRSHKAQGNLQPSSRLFFVRLVEDYESFYNTISQRYNIAINSHAHAATRYNYGNLLSFRSRNVAAKSS